MYYLENDEGFLSKDDAIVDDLDFAQGFRTRENAQKWINDHPNPDDWDIYETI